MAREPGGERRIEFNDATGRGAIVFDPSRVEQAERPWFTPKFWGDRATLIGAGGRGAAWFIDRPEGDWVLRHYRRGGFAARFSREGYMWQGEDRARSVLEFRLAQELLRRGVPVPVPVAAAYERSAMRYRAALLMERLPRVRTLAELATERQAPWEAAGRLVAQAHRAGLDHADLNATNLVFDEAGNGWVIDLDRGLLRAAGIGWRRRNLERLERSLLKLRGDRGVVEVECDFARLRKAYDEAFEHG